MTDKSFDEIADEAFELRRKALLNHRQLGIHGMVRDVAYDSDSDSAGRNFDNIVEGLHFHATSGAGTNSESVVDVVTDTLLYHADDYGNSVSVFRFGPWVSVLQELSREIREKNDEAERQKKLDEFKQIEEDFSEVDI